MGSVEPIDSAAPGGLSLTRRLLLQLGLGAGLLAVLAPYRARAAPSYRADSTTLTADSTLLISQLG